MKLYNIGTPSLSRLSFANTIFNVRNVLKSEGDYIFNFFSLILIPGILSILIFLSFSGASEIELDNGLVPNLFHVFVSAIFFIIYPLYVLRTVVQFLRKSDEQAEYSKNYNEGKYGELSKNREARFIFDIAHDYDEVKLLFNRVTEEVRIFKWNSLVVFRSAAIDYIVLFSSLFATYAAYQVEPLSMSGHAWLIPEVFFSFTLALFALSRALLLISTLILSFGSFGFLNILSNSTIKSRVFGSDYNSELRYNKNPKDSISVTIPQLVAASLLDHSNSALSKRIGTMRDFAFKFVAENEGVERLLSEFTWDELVHTSYFRHPETRKFILDTVMGER